MNDVIDEIIQLLDSMTLLGAAYDCMSDAGKERFKDKLRQILEHAPC